MRFLTLLALMGLTISPLLASSVQPFPEAIRGSYRVQRMLETTVPVSQKAFPEINYSDAAFTEVAADKNIMVVLGRTTMRVALEGEIASSEVPKEMWHDRDHENGLWITGFQSHTPGAKGALMRFDNGRMVFVIVFEEEGKRTKVRHVWVCTLID